MFDYFKDLIVRWYKELKEKGSSNKSSKKPEFKHPDTGLLLDYDSLIEMFEKEPLTQQFKTFFPAMFTE